MKKNKDGQANVMIVEDDHLIGNILTRHFLLLNYKTHLVPSAEDAKDVLKKEPIDIILLDIMLPGMNGITFLKEIKADTALKNIPVIVISNFGKQEYVDESMKAGALDYLIKANCSPDEIIQKIQKLLPSAQPHPNMPS